MNPRSFSSLLLLCRFVPLLMMGIALLAPRAAGAAGAPLQGAAILQDLRRFRQMGSVLYVAAHPDDENTQLITFLARGRGYRTAYLSLTRGDGGQNVLGGEFGAQLGVIRTQELLAARRLDGGQQFFTRALDFGFSKDYRETLRIWDRQQVLADIVRVIRTFRPDVMITRFSPIPGNTHGHHTASAVLAVEAFKLAGDPKAFPEQLGDLAPWQPKRLLQNGGGSDALQMDIGGVDPVLRESFADIAARSRAMHKSQGFGNYGGQHTSHPESFQLLAGDPATRDILDGVDTTWNRIPGAANIGQMADKIINAFDPNDPAASVPALLSLRTLLTALPPDPLVNEKRRDFDKILQECLGLTVQTVIPNAEIIPGETIKLSQTALVQSTIPVRWEDVNYPATRSRTSVGTTLKVGQAASRETTLTLPVSTPLSGPYWLREDGTVGMFRVDDPKLIGRPENPPSFPVEYRFEVGGQTFLVPDEPVQVTVDASMPQSRRLEVIPPVSLRFTTDVRLFGPGESRPVDVEITTARPGSNGSLQLDIPTGWKVQPASRQFGLATAGDHARLSFLVTAPPLPATANIRAHAVVNGLQYDTGRIEIHYAHIPPLLLHPRAHLKAVALNLAIRVHEVGYLPGAGDSVAEALTEMGCKVTILSGADLTADRLRHFDAVVIGVRAFNVRTDLVDNLPALFAYVEGGGNVVVQYNRPEDLKTNKLAPVNLTVSKLRVTDEQAPVTFLAPDHPALNTPNKITTADFEGWVQERGVYYPSDWDKQFTPLLASGDPGEEPLKGGLLVAKYGRGYYVYTGLAFFRQLPAGVPGAFRLFANLVSIGK